MEHLDFIVKVFIPILGALVVYIIVPLIKEKTTKEQRENIYQFVKIAVNAAEQMQKAGLITIPKKEYVLQSLAEQGLKINIKELNEMIEAAVFELNKIKAEIEE